MQFTEKHERALDNVLKTLRRCQVPEITGEEMLAFTSGYVVVQEIHAFIKKLLDEQKARQALAAQQAKIAQVETPTEPKNASESPKPSKRRKK